MDDKGKYKGNDDESKWEGAEEKGGRDQEEWMIDNKRARKKKSRS